jgi:HSP20 family protein
MAIRDLIPWRRERAPVRREEQDSFLSFRQDMDRMFDRFFESSALAPWGEEWSGFAPSVDVVETDEEVKVTAELPGLDAEDVDVTLSHNTLTLKGEKHQEHEEEGEGYYRSERSYGSFQRSIPLPSTVETDKAEASFSKGVLTITFPKTAAETDKKKITVKTN